MAMPRPRPPAVSAVGRDLGLKRGAGAIAAAAGGVPAAGWSSAGSGHPRCLLDLGDRAGLRSEELLGGPRPTAQVLDREQLRRGRELARELARHRLEDRAVALLRPDGLPRGRPLPVDERLR